MKKLAMVAAAATMALTSTQAFAVSDNVVFNAELTATCTIAINNGGVLAPNASFTQLSSSSGGTSGVATVTTNMPGFNASVADVASWDAEPAGNPATTFTETMTIGAASYGSATNAPLGIGNTTVNVDLVADAAAPGSYGPGTYQATVVLTCE